MERKS